MINRKKRYVANWHLTEKIKIKLHRQEKERKICLRMRRANRIKKQQ